MKRSLALLFVVGCTSAPPPGTSSGGEHAPDELVRFVHVHLEVETVPAACGVCSTGLAVVADDGARTPALPRDPDAWHTLSPFTESGVFVDASGEWVDHPGSCGDGSCRSFQILGVQRAD